MKDAMKLHHVKYRIQEAYPILATELMDVLDAAAFNLVLKLFLVLNLYGSLMISTGSNGRMRLHTSQLQH